MRPRRRRPARAATSRPGPRRGRQPPNPVQPRRRRRPRPLSLPPQRLRPTAAQARRRHAPARHIPQAHRTRARRSVAPRRAPLQAAHAGPKRARSCRRTDCSSVRLSRGPVQRCRQTTSAPACREPQYSRQRPRAEARPRGQSAPAQVDALCPRGRRRGAAQPHTTPNNGRLRPPSSGRSAPGWCDGAYVWCVPFFSRLSQERCGFSLAAGSHRHRTTQEKPRFPGCHVSYLSGLLSTSVDAGWNLPALNRQAVVALPVGQQSASWGP